MKINYEKVYTDNNDLTIGDKIIQLKKKKSFVNKRSIYKENYGYAYKI